MSNGEKNYSYTTKFNGNLLTVRGDSVQEFGQNIQALSADIGALISQMEQGLNAGGTLNQTLGATPVDPPSNPEPQQAQQAAPTQQDPGPWGNAPQGNGQWGQPPQQQGGNNWGQPPAQQGGWGQPQQGGGAEAWRADASIQPPHLQPPMTPFGPAKYWGKNKPDGKQSRAWADPRPFQQVKNLPKDQKFWQWIDDKDL